MTPKAPPVADPDATLKEQVEENAGYRKYGTLAGVHTPTLLTILGVIMFLRQGTVVGNAGLGGAWLIIGLVCAIVACTALSLSSITINIRIGAGGAYSIISQSLGLEVGGNLGVPSTSPRPSPSPCTSSGSERVGSSSSPSIRLWSST